jgi:hypothetical protein
MRSAQRRCLVALLLAQALTSAVAAHDDVSRAARAEALRRAGDDTTPRRTQRPRLYPRNVAYVRQLPTGSGLRARIPYRAGPSGGSYENGDCPAGVRSTLVCVKVTDDRDGDPFVEALLDTPSKKTIVLLDRLGIPAIKDVPPIVIINPALGALQLDFLGLPSFKSVIRGKDRE